MSVARAHSIDGSGEYADQLGTERELPSLPAVDTSKEAWAYVAASFVMEMLLWGPIFASAVYLKHYAALPQFASSSETQIAFVGTLPILIGYSLGLPLLYFYNHFPRAMKPSIWVGLALYTVSMLAASFVSNMKLLILFQGVGPGVAAALVAFPIIRWLPEWFDLRKGTAGGIVFAGGGVGGVYMPFLEEGLINHLGYNWSLRITAILTAVLGGIAIFFVNPRVPISPRAHIVRMPMPPFFDTFMRWGFFGTFFCCLLQGFGYFNVGLFLPRFSDSLGGAAGTGLLAAFNITDKMRPAQAMAISSVLGTILTLTFWGIGGSKGISLLAPFAILFGLATGGFPSMWFQGAHDIAGPDQGRQSLLSVGWYVARGVGGIVGPSVGSALYRLPTSPSNRWGSAGSPELVGLVAASLAASAIVVLLFRYASDVSKYISKLVGKGKEGVSGEGHGMEMGVVTR
ncbi:hypothetical protein I350_01026 [Cryptococcus amylolentus CBS 6273]|uniref:Major facilitator superfamily (MFS) profile domain-containing protein n=1 Tax=Cryptococcus amylolentus CBS 6273 TaxID=1296118 RepID=A0A1E3KBJ8_9TREE|nr:hypothetical protein I350_01026 [Cryptococcus amylolentus CBS 6273]